MLCVVVARVPQVVVARGCTNRSRVTGTEERLSGSHRSIRIRKQRRGVRSCGVRTAVGCRHYCVVGATLAAGDALRRIARAPQVALTAGGRERYAAAGTEGQAAAGCDTRVRIGKQRCGVRSCGVRTAVGCRHYCVVGATLAACDALRRVARAPQVALTAGGRERYAAAGTEGQAAAGCDTRVRIGKQRCGVRSCGVRTAVGCRHYCVVGATLAASDALRRVARAPQVALTAGGRERYAAAGTEGQAAAGCDTRVRIGKQRCGVRSRSIRTAVGCRHYCVVGATLAASDALRRCSGVPQVALTAGGRKRYAAAGTEGQAAVGCDTRVRIGKQRCGVRSCGVRTAVGCRHYCVVGATLAAGDALRRVARAPQVALTAGGRERYTAAGTEGQAAVGCDTRVRIGKQRCGVRSRRVRTAVGCRHYCVVGTTLAASDALRRVARAPQVALTAGGRERYAAAGTEGQAAASSDTCVRHRIICQRE